MRVGETCGIGDFFVTLHSQKRVMASALAAIAQSVEHFIRNEKVVGSSPTRGSKEKALKASNSRAGFLIF